MSRDGQKINKKNENKENKENYDTCRESNRKIKSKEINKQQQNPGQSLTARISPNSEKSINPDEIKQKQPKPPAPIEVNGHLPNGHISPPKLNGHSHGHQAREAENLKDLLLNKIVEDKLARLQVEADRKQNGDHLADIPHRSKIVLSDEEDSRASLQSNGLGSVKHTFIRPDSVANSIYSDLEGPDIGLVAFRGSHALV